MIGLMMLAAAVPNVRAFVSGNDLYAMCQMTEQSACRLYVAGVSDTISSVTTYGIMRPFVCYPSGVTNGQVADVITAHLRAHPKQGILTQRG